TYNFEEQTRQRQISKHVKKGINLEDTSKGISIQKYTSLKKQMEDYEGLKDEILKNFNSNLSKIESLIKSLSKTPIDQLISSVEKTKNELKKIKSTFSEQLDSLLTLNKKSDIKS
ncbi:MAG: hypothetical protein ACOC35_09355, partial [Promethearchaeia archaeon]